MGERCHGYVRYTYRYISKSLKLFSAAIVASMACMFMHSNPVTGLQ